MIVQIHLDRSYLGSVEIDGDTPEINPDALVESWYLEFLQVMHMTCYDFVAFLEARNYAVEMDWDGNPYDTPHHVYLDSRNLDKRNAGPGN